MKKDDVPKELASLLADKEWRLQNLYHIENKKGLLVRFRLNHAQMRLVKESHHRWDILKARQLGISTFASVLMLDACLFAGDKSIECAIVDKTSDDAKSKLRKVVCAFEALDRLPLNPTQEDRALAYVGGLVKMSLSMSAKAETVEFSNGCKISAGTSKRGGTVQILHISELGYTAIHHPQKAREIISGSQNAVPLDGLIIRESTHEGGRTGLNYELLKASMSKQHDQCLSPLDFRFFFFSWHEHPEYVLPGIKPVLCQELADYFIKLKEKHGIDLSDERKAWYASMWASMPLGLMKQEYPSTPDEAFDTSIEGAIFAERITLAETQGRVGRVVAPDVYSPLYVTFDLGVGDDTTMWLFQPREDGFYYALDYYANAGQGMDHYIEQLRRWERTHGKMVELVLLPHDAAKRSQMSGLSFADEFRKFGLPYKVLKRIDNLWQGIAFARRLIDRCVFTERVDVSLEAGALRPSGLNCLRNYRTAPMSANGGIKDMPVHDICSHGADSFRYMAEAIELGYIGRAGNVGAIGRHAAAVQVSRGLGW